MIWQQTQPTCNIRVFAANVVAKLSASQSVGRMQSSLESSHVFTKTDQPVD